MSGVRNPISYLDLDRANPTAVVLEKTFRDAVEYKKEIDDGFDAIVLTEPTLASKSADAVLNNLAEKEQDKDSSSRSTYCCMVRILGPDSPHNLLPDPFDFYLTDDEECQKRYSNLIQMHTMLTLSKISNADRPEIGDIVRLKMAKAQRSFSTKFAKDYRGIKTKKNAASREFREKAEKLEDNSKKQFKKGKIQKSGGNVTSYYKFKKDLSVLEPESRKKFEAFFKDLRDNDYKPIISSSKRSVKHQWNYYTKRLKSAGQQAKPCYSDHQYGFALDINFTDPSGKFVSWKSTKSSKYRKTIPEAQWGTKQDWQKVANIAKKHGIGWQGWKDVVHFYDIEGNKSEKKKQLKAKCKAIYYTALGEDPWQWSEDFKDLPDAITTPAEGDWSSYQQQLRDSVNKAH